jgi:hypothetical protein
MASRGPAGVDLGHCRLNLVRTFDVGAADRFLEAWRHAAGRPHFDLHPYWDLVAAVGWGPSTHATASPQLHQRVEAFVGAAVSRL